MPAADLSNSQARRRAAEEEAAAKEKAKESEIIPAETAFLVYRRSDTGQIVMTHDINVPLQVLRSPNHDDVFMMMQVIIKDMTSAQVAALTVQQTLQVQQQMAQQMMSPQEQAAMQAALSGR